MTPVHQVKIKREANAIDRILKAWNLPVLGSPDVVPALGRIVQDHTHFAEILRACDPVLRREMYEALRPHLLFTAKPLEDYIVAAKEHAEAAGLPVMDENGFLHPYSPGVIGTAPAEIPVEELYVECARCHMGAHFSGARKADAIHAMRESGWAFDTSAQHRHMCPACLDAYALDT